MRISNHNNNHAHTSEHSSSVIVVILVSRVSLVGHNQIKCGINAMRPRHTPSLVPVAHNVDNSIWNWYACMHHYMTTHTHTHAHTHIHTHACTQRRPTAQPHSHPPTCNASNDIVRPRHQHHHIGRRRRRRRRQRRQSMIVSVVFRLLEIHFSFTLMARIFMFECYAVVSSSSPSPSSSTWRRWRQRQRQWQPNNILRSSDVCHIFAFVVCYSHSNGIQMVAAKQPPLSGIVRQNEQSVFGRFVTKKNVVSQIDH